MFFVYFCLFSCSEIKVQEQEPQSPKVEVLRTPKHVTSSQSDYVQKSFLCCTNEAFQNILTTYVDLTQAMARDQEKVSLEKRNNLEEQLSQIQKNTANKDIKQLYSLVKEQQPTSLSDLQKNFAPFSIKMVEWIQSISKNDVQTKKSDPNAKKEILAENSNSELQVIVGFCPMAPPPGRWIQREDVIQNPFYGSKMLTCGVFE